MKISESKANKLKTMHTSKQETLEGSSRNKNKSRKDLQNYYCNNQEHVN